MSDTILKADATFGVKVEPGDSVKIGQEIGTNPDTGQTLTSPLAGTVKDVSFDPENHLFNVRLAKN